MPFYRLRVTDAGLSANGELMGVWDHFYEDSVFSAEVLTHYMNLPHVLRLDQTLDLEALPTEQHWRWQAAQEAAVADDVHPYVRLYAQWVVGHLL